MTISRLLHHPVIASLVVVALLATSASAQEAAPGSQFVNIKTLDPNIVIDLRYAGSNNVMHRPLYPPGMPAMVRESVAQRVVVAQKYLRSQRGSFRLKIWDAYRPQSVQNQLWEATRNNSFVADPRDGIGSLHTRGAAVDATLVDASGRELAMPTDFDSFTPAAFLYYQGSNALIRSNLNLLQRAMANAGFYGLRTEWWHFCAPDWTNYEPVAEIQLLAPGKQQRL